MGAAFSIKQGDRLPALSATLEQDTPGLGKTPIDLTGSSIKLVLTLKDATSPAVVGNATIVDAVNGKVRYDWASNDTSKSGLYDAEWHVIFIGGLPQKVPTVGFFDVFIEPSLSET